MIIMAKTPDNKGGIVVGWAREKKGGIVVGWARVMNSISIVWTWRWNSVLWEAVDTTNRTLVPTACSWDFMGVFTVWLSFADCIVNSCSHLQPRSWKAEYVLWLPYQSLIIRSVEHGQSHPVACLPRVELPQEMGYPSEALAADNHICMKKTSFAKDHRYSERNWAQDFLKSLAGFVLEMEVLSMGGRVKC